MKFLPLFRSVSLLTMGLAGASLSHAQFTNAGFEAGSLAGWEIAPAAHASAVGSVTDYPIDPFTLTSDLTRPYSVSPYHGSFQARLVAGATKLGTVESFLNLTSGSLSSARNNPFGLADASAIAQSVWLNAGDTFAVRWNFLAVDTAEVNDFAFLSLSGTNGSSVSQLSNIANAGSGQGTGWQTSWITADVSGQYRLGLGVANFEDNTVGSILYVDAISAVPEPSTYGLVAACICLGAAVWRGRRTGSP